MLELLIGILIGFIGTLLAGMAYASYHIKQYKDVNENVEDMLQEVKSHEWHADQKENIVRLKSNSELEDKVVEFAAEQISDSSISYNHMFGIKKILLDKESDEGASILKVKIKKVEEDYDADGNNTEDNDEEEK